MMNSAGKPTQAKQLYLSQQNEKINLFKNRIQESNLVASKQESLKNSQRSISPL